MGGFPIRWLGVWSGVGKGGEGDGGYHGSFCAFHEGGTFLAARRGIRGLRVEEKEEEEED